MVLLFVITLALWLTVNPVPNKYSKLQLDRIHPEKWTTVDMAVLKSWLYLDLYWPGHNGKKPLKNVTNRQHDDQQMHAKRSRIQDTCIFISVENTYSESRNFHIQVLVG